jgi:hypothetical protein
MLIDEELCFHEDIFYFDPLKLSHLVVSFIFFLGFPSKQPNLLLQIFEFLLNDGDMVGQLLDALIQMFDGFDKLPQIVLLGTLPCIQLAILLLKTLCLIPCNPKLVHVHHSS